MTKLYIVWWTFGLTNMPLPTPIEAGNKKEAIRKFKEKGENYNEIIRVVEEKEEA